MIQYTHNETENGGICMYHASMGCISELQTLWTNPCFVTFDVLLYVLIVCSLYLPRLQEVTQQLTLMTWSVFCSVFGIGIRRHV